MDRKRLRSELARPGPLSLETREWFASSVIPLLALAERRITEGEIERLEALVATLPDYPPVRGPREFRTQFWQTIAEATRNPVVIENVKWWAGAMEEREQLTGDDSSGPERIIPKAKYLGLILALRRGSGAPAFWTEVIEELLY